MKKINVGWQILQAIDSNNPQELSRVLKGNELLVNSELPNHQTPLQYVASYNGEDGNNRRRLADVLIKCGANVSQTPPNGLSPFNLALIHNHPQIAAYLLAIHCGYQAKYNKLYRWDKSMDDYFNLTEPQFVFSDPPGIVNISFQ